MKKHPVRRTKTEMNGGFVLGRAAIAKINAVEGITPSRAASERTAEFDERGLTISERREEIIRAYRAKT